MNKECPHDNVVDAGAYPKMKYTVDTKENVYISNLLELEK